MELFSRASLSLINNSDDMAVIVCWITTRHSRVNSSVCHDVM